MALLIAEIGNNHFGDINKFKELIKRCKDSGADLVKSQAFKAEDAKEWGSMPEEFYEQCELGEGVLLEMIHWSRDVAGIELFYSIVSDGFFSLKDAQKYHKITAAQTSEIVLKHGSALMLNMDQSNMFISTPNGLYLEDNFNNAHIMYATPYEPEENILGQLKSINRVRDRPMGLSDHSEGIGLSIDAVTYAGAPVIEKHVCLEKFQKFKNVTFRDTVFGLLPNELETLAKAIK